MTTDQIPQLLSEEQINIIAIGNIIFETTKEYSQRVNDEVISPIATWLDDPDFIERHKVRIEDVAPNWAEYKREQRNYNILIAHEALRLKRQQEKLRKDYLKRIAGLIPRSRGEPTPAQSTSAKDYVSCIASLLSPQTKEKIDLAQEFDHARNLPISLKLPWQTILSSMITRPTSFNDLPEIYPESHRSDLTAKLQTLLQMETDGLISMGQIEPFADISISPQGIEFSAGSIIIKNKAGAKSEINWKSLNDEQQFELIANIKENKVMCVGA